MSAATALATAKVRGVAVHAEGDRLRWRGPRGAMTPDLAAELQRHKAEILRALAVNDGPAGELDVGADVPREWAEGVARLRRMAPLRGYTPDRWRILVADAGAFLDGQASEAVRLGWSTLDVFGVSANAPAERLDAAGLVPVLNGCKVVELHAYHAVLRTPTGKRQTCQRPGNPRTRRVPIWEVG